MNTAYENFIAGLDPKIARTLKTAQEITSEMLPSASLEYNWATGGGFPRAAITTLYGNYSSTKTALTLQTIALLQKLGYVCAFVDAEKSFKKDWAIKMGVDLDSLIVIRKVSFGAIVDEVVPLIKGGIDFLVWDSISQTLPEQFVDDKGEMKEFGSQKQIGAASQSAGVAIRAMHYMNKRTAIVLISQTRVDMTGMHPMQKPTNGRAVEFGSSVMVRLQASGAESQQIKGQVFVGDKIHEMPIGREVKFDVVKNKVGPPNRTGKYNFYYAGDSLGIDNVAELVSLAVRFGVVKGNIPWYTYGDQKWQGAKNLTAALKEDRGLFEQIKADVELMTTGEVPDESMGEVQEATAE